MLKLQFRDRRREAVWLVDNQFTIGKNAKNSLMIDDISIQEFHAEILNTGDQLTIVDKTAGKGLKVNNAPVTGHANLKVNDTIQLGNITLELVDPKADIAAHAVQAQQSRQWSISSKASWLEQGAYIINQTTIIGRDPSCDICLPLDHLSRRHVELSLQGGQLYIKDLNSSNGTYVNGHQITETPLKTGDKIKLDVVTFDVNGPGHDPNKTIIRQAPAQNIPPKAPNSPQKSAKASAKASSSKKQNEPKQQKLVAEGKQDWLAGTSTNTKEKSSRTGAKIVMVTGVILMISAIALLLSTN